MVLDGHSRLLAAQVGGMDRQTLRDWVHRYNAEGVPGLVDAGGTGRKPALSAQQMEVLKDLVLAGPDLAVDGVVRWRCADLQLALMKRFDVVVHERTVGKGLLTRQAPPAKWQSSAIADGALSGLTSLPSPCVRTGPREGLANPARPQAVEREWQTRQAWHCHGGAGHPVMVLRLNGVTRELSG